VVLIRKMGERDWHAPASSAYRDEASLEALLEEAPSLLPGPDDDKPLVVVRQLSVEHGSIDLVGVSRSGAITVVECKLSQNPEIRRSVVGQVFAYAASLWRMGFDDLDRAFQLRSKGSVIDAMSAVLAESDPEWDATTFRDAVIENLAEGRFRLVLAVDAVTPELRHIVEYLNEHMVSEVLVVAVELAYIASDGVEILEPRVYGEEMGVRRPPPPVGRQWDEVTFMDALAGGEAEQRVVRAALAWATERGLRVWYGKGRTQGSFMPILDMPDGESYGFFAMRTNARVEIEFGTLKTRPPFDQREMRLELLRRLQGIEGVEIAEGKADLYPSFAMQILASEEAQATFLAVIDWALARVRASPS
jgi:hypothetical protein